MGTLKIGMFEQDITPREPVLLPGQFYKRVSTHVESEIKAEIFALETDGEQLIIVAVDTTHIAYNLTELVHKLTAEKCGEIDTAKIILAATHIHTAPGYAEKRKGFFSSINKYFPEDYTFKQAVESDDYMSTEVYLYLAGDGLQAHRYHQRHSA